MNKNINLSIVPFTESFNCDNTSQSSLTFHPNPSSQCQLSTSHKTLLSTLWSSRHIPGSPVSSVSTTVYKSYLSGCVGSVQCVQIPPIWPPAVFLCPPVCPVYCPLQCPDVQYVQILLACCVDLSTSVSSLLSTTVSRCPVCTNPIRLTACGVTLWAVNGPLYIVWVDILSRRLQQTS